MDMTKEEIFNTVKTITVDELDVDENRVTMDARIKDDLDADSLDVFEIMNELEDKFEIELDADEGIETISDVVDFVMKQLDEKYCTTEYYLAVKVHSDREWESSLWPTPFFQGLLVRQALFVNLICSKL